MTIYFLLAAAMLGLWALFYFLEHSGRMCPNTARITYLVIVVLLLSLLAGLRYGSVGADTWAYLKFFNHLETGARFEFGFRILRRIVAFFASRAAVFFFVCALLTNASIAFVVYKASANSYMSMVLWLFLYYYFNSFNAMRQYIAVAFLLIAFYYASEKKWLLYALFQVLAVGFHNTALAGLLFIFLFAWDTPRTARIKQVLMVAATALSVLFWQPLLNFVAQLLPAYYAHYITGGNMLISRTGGFRQSVIYGSIFVVFFLFTNPNTPARKRYTNGMLLTVMLAFLVMRALIFERFLAYFEPISILVIPEICASDYRIKDNRLRLAFSAAILSVCGALMTYLLIKNVMEVTPYISIL